MLGFVASQTQRTEESTMEPTAHSYFSIPPRNFDLRAARNAGPRLEQTAPANAADIRRVLARQDAGRADLAGSAFSYRHDWGHLAGDCHLFLRWDAIDPASRIFVSIAEGQAGGHDGGKCVGTAKISLFDVAPTSGGIGVRLHVDGDRPIRVFADYLVINA
jgi:hypothetical protein